MQCRQLLGIFQLNGIHAFEFTICKQYISQGRIIYLGCSVSKILNWECWYSEHCCDSLLNYSNHISWTVWYDIKIYRMFCCNDSNILYQTRTVERTYKTERNYSRWFINSEHTALISTIIAMIATWDDRMSIMDSKIVTLAGRKSRLTASAGNVRNLTPREFSL